MIQKRFPKLSNEDEAMRSLGSLNAERRKDVKNLVMSQERIDAKTVEKLGITRKDTTPSPLSRDSTS